MHFVSTHFARLIVRELRPAPAQWPALLADTQQTEAAIQHHQQLPLAEFNTLLGNALRLSADPALGLRFGRHANLLALGEGGIAALTAPNLLLTLRSFVDYGRLQADYMDFDIVVGEVLRFRGHENIALPQAVRRTQHEVMVLTLQNTIEMMLGRPFTQGRYYFAYPRPDYAELYPQHFHSACEFDAPATGVDVPRALGDVASPYYDLNQWERSKNRCMQLMQALNGTQRKLHREYVLTQLRSHRPPLPAAQQVAAELNLSTRTLNRRLAEDGASYRALRNQVLNEWACHALQETSDSVEAIAAQLGYQDGANFRRAFKRANGCSPQAWRQSAGS